MHGSSSEPAFASGGSPGRGRLRQARIAAARAALDHAGVAADEIDLIILATHLDNTFPATAASVQAGLGITTGAAFDVQAVCSGFVYALTTADAFLRAGTASSARWWSGRDFFADTRLVGPRDLRAVWRRCRRGGAACPRRHRRGAGASAASMRP